MTNKINNQLANIVENEFRINTGLKQSNIGSSNIRYETAPQQVHISVSEETNREIRRYSFDDNGGGYLGL